MSEFKLIAEIGVNHLGSVRLAKEIINAGRSVGLNLFKFQLFHIDEITTDRSWEWYDYMAHCALSKEEHFELKEYCESLGAIYFASVFGDWSFQIAQKMEMPIYKIASRSLYTHDGRISELAEKIYDTGVDVVSSLGYWEFPWVIPFRDNNQNLYCVSKYPTTREDINWPDFRLNRNGKREISGFSDHSIGTELAKEAIDKGAVIIEKHFTCDTSLYGPDQKGSAMPNEMKEILDYAESHGLDVGL